jgi:hypothetical protein
MSVTRQLGQDLSGAEVRRGIHRDENLVGDV